LLAARHHLAEVRRAEDAQAHQRSLDLLLSCLTPAQRAQFHRSHAFVVSGKSGAQYRINYGSVSNVEVITVNGTVNHRLCAGPVGIPIPAAMLSQKLMLEAQESEFLRIAARHPAMLVARGAAYDSAIFPGG
jgi:hypothetical protein